MDIYKPFETRGNKNAMTKQISSHLKFSSAALGNCCFMSQLTIFQSYIDSFVAEGLTYCQNPHHRQRVGFLKNSIFSPLHHIGDSCLQTYLALQWTGHLPS